MANDVLQRPMWTGEPKDLGELFILRKNGREAACKLLTHVFGWECRLYIGQQEEIVQTEVCRDQAAVFSTGEKWKAALQTKGWA